MDVVDSEAQTSSAQQAQQRRLACYVTSSRLFAGMLTSNITPSIMFLGVAAQPTLLRPGYIGGGLQSQEHS